MEFLMTYTWIQVTGIHMMAANCFIDINQLCELNVDVWKELMSETMNPPAFMREACQELANSFLCRYYGINCCDENIYFLYHQEARGE